MQELPYVLSEYEEINSVLYKPINSTQRIKYTCFGTSPNYIVLGSTSGSVYLFSRKPCSFQQLIPLSEGAVSRVVISPDENKLALATARGSVCLLALKPTSKMIAISTERIHDQVRCLCWNENSTEVYIGDETGKVCVMVLSIFTVNGMFQTPVSMLMTLESAIVHLSFSFPLLLVSTLSRCYVCDTVQEQYKHIGNKARNGEFGACFYKTCPETQKSTFASQKEEKLVGRKHSFNFIPHGNDEVEEENFPKIFCARPGSRLWEVSANGIVMNTHQFKEALAIPPVRICKRDIRKTGVCEKQMSLSNWTAQSINFSYLSVVAEKYLFSYTSNGLYVIDPATATVVLWCDELVETVMAETIGNRIYTMSSHGEFHCLTLSGLDTVILRLYRRKQYHDCLDVCLSHRVQLERFVNDNHVRKICDIESKSELCKDEELSTILRPITLALQSNLDGSPKKLDSGIVVVHSGNLDFKDQDFFTYVSASRAHSSLRTDEIASGMLKEPEKAEKTEKSKERKTNETDDENCNTESLLKLEFVSNEVVLKDKDKDEQNSEKSTARGVEIDVEEIYALSDSIKPWMTEQELETVILDIDRRVNAIQDSYKMFSELNNFEFEVVRRAEMYYSNALLENVSCQLISACTNDQVLKQLITAFVDVNIQCCARCNCSYPFPINQLTEPKFFRIGRSLLTKLINESNEFKCANLCNKVPYMWREFLPGYVEQRGVVSNEIIRQCLQTRDTIILSTLFPLLDSKQCSLLAACLLKMKEGRCLFCANTMTKLSEPLIDWNGVIREITKNKGPDFAITVLTRLERAIPNIPIDRSIFQSLVFTKILHQHGMMCAVDFDKSTLDSSECNAMCSTKVRDQLIDVLEKDLGEPVNESMFGSGAHHWGMRYQHKSSTCPCCTLSLQTPVLLGNNGIAIFRCGHAYHVNCMIERKLTTCNLH